MQEIQQLLKKLRTSNIQSDHKDSNAMVFEEFFIKHLVEQLQDPTIAAMRKIAILEFWFTPPSRADYHNDIPRSNTSELDPNPFVRVKLSNSRSYNWIRNNYYG